MLLLIGLELRCRRGSVIVIVVDKGVDGNGSVGRVDVPPSVVGRSLNLTDLLYVGRPNASSCLASLDSNHNEGDYIPKNYKGSRSTRPTRLNLLRSLRSIELRKQNVVITWRGVKATVDC